MRIGIVFAVIVTVLFNRLMRSKFLEPDLEIMVKAGFIVIDEDGSSDMHGIDQNQSFLNTTLPETCFNLRSDIDESPPCRHLKPQLFSVALHNPLLKWKSCLVTIPSLFLQVVSIINSEIISHAT